MLLVVLTARFFKFLAFFGGANERCDSDSRGAGVSGDGPGVSDSEGTFIRDGVVSGEDSRELEMSPSPDPVCVCESVPLVEGFEGKLRNGLPASLKRSRSPYTGV